MGHYNLANILAASSTALGLGIPPDQVVTGLAAITGVDGRLEPVALPGQPLVLVDYAHTPDALQQVLKALQALDFNRIITVFGCGGDRDRTKRPLMGQAAAQGSDLVIVTSDNPRTEDPLAIIAHIEAGLIDLGYHLLDVADLNPPARDICVFPIAARLSAWPLPSVPPGTSSCWPAKDMKTIRLSGPGDSISTIARKPGPSPAGQNRAKTVHEPLQCHSRPLDTGTKWIDRS